MKHLVLLVLLIYSLVVEAQQTIYRSDTVSMAVNGIILPISLSIGFEIPFKNNSVVAHSFNNAFYDQGFYAGPSFDRNLMLELRHYFKKSLLDRNKFISLFTRYRSIDHVAPDEGVYDADWFLSKEWNIGLLLGTKKYQKSGIYVEWFWGVFLGLRDGVLRTDPEPQDSGDPLYENKREDRVGLIIGVKIGFEPFNKKK